MQLERPRFRQDLVAEPIEDGNSKFIDVMDPDSNTVYRFYEVEYSLACAMDGERDVAGVVRWAQEELGLSTTANEVKSVIATLGDLRFLDTAAPQPAAAAAASKLWDTAATAPSAQATPAGPPALAAADDDDLKAGVIVGQARSQPPVADMELGNAGAMPRAAAQPYAIAANDVELAAGVSTGAGAQAGVSHKAEDIALGVPGRADLPVDLGDQVQLSRSDVKEAVQAAKATDAGELSADLKSTGARANEKSGGKSKRPPRTPAKGAPVVDAKNLAAVVEGTKAAEAAEAAKTAEAAKAANPVAAAKAAEAAKAEAAKAVTATKAAEAAKAESTKAAAAAKVAAKPAEAKQPAAKSAVAPPAPEQKVSRPLLVGLVVVVLAVVAFLVYKNVIAKHAAETENTPPPKMEPVQPAPPPPPPAVESEKLATNVSASDSIKPVSAGMIEMIAASATKVKEGDAVVRFTGAKALATEIAALEKDVEGRVKNELYKSQQERDAAIASGNKAAQLSFETKVTDRQKSLDDKQAKLGVKRGELDKLEIKAPATGTFTAKATAGSKVTPTDEVGTLAREPMRTVTFKSIDPAAGPRSRVVLVTKDNVKLACVVASTDSTGTVIECPMSESTEGAEVTFGGVEPVPQGATGSDASVPPAAGSGAAGSGATGSGAAGSGAAAAGAAPATAVPSHAPVRPAPAPRPRPAPKAPAAGTGAPAAVEVPAEKPAAPPAGSDQ